MSDDDQTQAVKHEQQIECGCLVYSADGHQIGTVDAVHVSYFVAAKGLFFPQDRFVPHSAINRIDQDGIHLVHRHREIEALGWWSIPEETPAQSAPAPQGLEPSWDAVRGEHEARWRAERNDDQEHWADVEPLHRYGWELAHNRRYRYLLWSEIEESARQDWEAEHPDRLWSAVAPSIKRAWEHATQGDAEPARAPLAIEEAERALRTAAQQGQLSPGLTTSGDVQVRKERITELRTVQVPVTREELVVTRPAHEGDASAADTQRIPLREEQVVVQKEPLRE